MRLTILQLTWQLMLLSGNAFRDAWLPLHGLHQLDRPLPVGHQHLTDWDTEPQLPKKKISGRPGLK